MPTKPKPKAFTLPEVQGFNAANAWPAELAAFNAWAPEPWIHNQTITNAEAHFACNAGYHFDIPLAGRAVEIRARVHLAGQGDHFEQPPQPRARREAASYRRSLACGRKALRKVQRAVPGWSQRPHQSGSP